MLNPLFSARRKSMKRLTQLTIASIVMIMMVVGCSTESSTNSTGGANQNIGEKQTGGSSSR
jgi:hypothetical protein